MSHTAYLMSKMKVYNINGLTRKKGISHLRKDPNMPSSGAAMHFEIDASRNGKAHISICLRKLSANGYDEKDVHAAIRQRCNKNITKILAFFEILWWADVIYEALAGIFILLGKRIGGWMMFGWFLVKIIICYSPYMLNAPRLPFTYR